MSSMEQRLLTPAEVAKCLQINEHTVLDWLRNGLLRGFKLGKAWRVSPEDFEDFLERRANRTIVAEEAGKSVPERETPKAVVSTVNGGNSRPEARPENRSSRNGSDNSQSGQDKAPLRPGFYIGQERRDKT